MTVFLAGSSLILSFFLFLFWIWGGQLSSVHVTPPSYGTLFLDAEGELLYFRRSEEDMYVLPLTDFSDLPISFIDAVLALEDKNFFVHGAVDVPATARAFVQNIASGRIVSGASTLTQQLAKNILGNTKRTWKNKIWEIIFAFRLERSFSKQEIFSLWANTASFSGNVVGISAASYFYFQKPPSELSLAQAAYLAGIPKNPAAYSPTRFPDRTEERKERVLLMMLQKDFITKSQYERALSEKIRPLFLPEPSSVNHIFSLGRTHGFAPTLLNKNSIQLTVRMSLQRDIEEIVRRHLDFLTGKNANNASVLIVENNTGAVRAYLGNIPNSPEEEVDMLRSYRQVGSTLKPFLYALAFEKLNWNANTIVLDEPVRFETAVGSSFSPKNFDLLYRGEITVREALAESRNVPAVTTLQKIGEDTFRSFLSSLGITFLQETDDVGLSLALGASEIRLLDLAKAYSVLAREGEDISLCFVSPCFSSGDQLLNKNIVQKTTGILADETARVESFGENSLISLPFPVAVKTGTTRNFRDNYSIGYTPEYTVLVWVGNTNGEVMENVSGVSGAGPILQDVFLTLPDSKGWDLGEVRGIDEMKKTIPSDSGRSQNDPASSLRILSPLSGERFQIDSERPLEQQKIRFSTTVSAQFFVNNLFIGEGEEVFWVPEKGTHILRVVSDNEEVSVEFMVE